MKVAFILPSAGGGGGSHSIVQEAVGLRRIGVDVSIATPRHLSAKFRVQYSDLQGRGVGNPIYSNDAELGGIIAQADLAIATTALSVRSVIDSWEQTHSSESPKLGYYVQDYEPLFYPLGTSEWDHARKSFGLMKDGLVFAKTDWLCQIVEANHGISVRRVQASIDHDTYFPIHMDTPEPIRVSAMVRPQTARRAPKRTLRILEQIAFNYPAAELSFFGCDLRDLELQGLYPSDALTCLGVLTRSQVATTLRHSDLFLDLSDFQAFGRTGLEGMACGCVPVLPIFGGAREYAEHYVNSYLVDTRSDGEIMKAVADFIGRSPEHRAKIRRAGIETALRYSVSKAAFTEYELFREFLDQEVMTGAA